MRVYRKRLGELLLENRIISNSDLQKALSIQGVDYTLHLEGIKVFSGKNNLSQTIAPLEYGHVTLRLSSAYWDIVQLFNKLPNKSDVAFSMQGSILVGGNRLFARRFTFDKQGIIPLQKTAQ